MVAAVVDHDLKGRFRSVNQGLNDEGRCCEVHAQILTKIPTLAATDWLLTRYASVTTSKNKKLLKIPNSSKLVVLYTKRFEILCSTIFYLGSYLLTPLVFPQIMKN